MLMARIEYLRDYIPNIDAKNTGKMNITLEKRFTIRYLLAISAIISFSLLLACDGSTVTGPITPEEADEFDLDLNDPTGPVDNGELWEPVETAAARAKSAIYRQSGDWSNAFNWPISAIHLSLLPDGRVLSYGTGTNVEEDRDDRGSGFTFDL